MTIIMTREKIEEIITQRGNMLMIHEVTGLLPGTEVTGTRLIGQDDLCPGEYNPQAPVVPGVMVLEMVVQAAGLCLLIQPENKGKSIFLMEVNKAKFSGKIVPGNRADISAKVVKSKGNISIVRGKVMEGKTKVMVCEITLALSTDKIEEKKG